MPRPPPSTLFPYTTLFRSRHARRLSADHHRFAAGGAAVHRAAQQRFGGGHWWFPAGHPADPADRRQPGLGPHRPPRRPGPTRGQQPTLIAFIICITKKGGRLAALFRLSGIFAGCADTRTNQRHRNDAARKPTACYAPRVTAPALFPCRNQRIDELAILAVARLLHRLINEAYHFVVRIIGLIVRPPPATDFVAEMPGEVVHLFGQDDILGQSQLAHLVQPAYLHQ